MVSYIYSHLQVGIPYRFSPHLQVSCCTVYSFHSLIVSLPTCSGINLLVILTLGPPYRIEKEEALIAGTLTVFLFALALSMPSTIITC